MATKNIGKRQSLFSSSSTRSLSEEETNQMIQKRAYELYLERGCTDGYDVVDWIKAEREIRKSL